MSLENWVIFGKAVRAICENRSHIAPALSIADFWQDLATHVVSVAVVTRHSPVE